MISEENEVKIVTRVWYGYVLFLQTMTIIAETVIDTAWKPIGTTQTGDHVSMYDGEVS